MGNPVALNPQEPFANLSHPKWIGLGKREVNIWPVATLDYPILCYPCAMRMLSSLNIIVTTVLSNRKHVRHPNYCQSAQGWEEESNCVRYLGYLVSMKIAFSCVKYTGKKYRQI
jgi:hypothetical protein